MRKAVLDAKTKAAEARDQLNNLVSFRWEAMQQKAREIDSALSSTRLALAQTRIAVRAVVMEAAEFPVGVLELLRGLQVKG